MFDKVCLTGSLAPTVAITKAISKASWDFAKSYQNHSIHSIKKLTDKLNKEEGPNNTFLLSLMLVNDMKIGESPVIMPQKSLLSH